ncbi:hypothetical protein AU255_18505 [Methyloprofundus sedimenti]|uniref:FecR protein domain-containing protein n=2 Tax=Methyloprofundus sedimenti TaxID=1420851 RepID=A0A1V8M0X3_9GAMM|nr:hypothetical protein AU255_18505 [Methyloprofundus sedimenti]
MLANKISLSNSKASYILSAILLLFCTAPFANERIGLVKTYTPDGFVVRQGVETALQTGSDIFQGDTLETGSEGAIGIIFKDGAVLTLGPNCKLSIDNFLFNPSEKKVSFVSRIIRGTVAFVSGAIGRISPDSVQFQTPTATLGLRGTKILIEVK